jgi:hypothetical protein
MNIVMVRYRVKTDRLDEHIEFISKVFEQLEAERPPDLQYASFKQPDGVSFVHLSIVNTADPNDPLTTLSAFKDFVHQISDRCDEPPLAVSLTEVGSYNVLANSS